MNQKQRQNRAKVKARRNRILRNPLGAAREESVAILRTLNRAAMLNQLHRAIRKSGARVMPGAPPHADASEPPPVRPLTEADAEFQVPSDLTITAGDLQHASDQPPQEPTSHDV